MTESSNTPEMVLSAYRQGYFPMARGRHGSIGYYHFEPRGIIPLDDRFTVRRSLRKIIEDHIFRISFDEAFEEVIRACARFDELPDSEVWISEEMIELYTELHRRGIVHSLEVWYGDRLAGGLYGLVIGSVFCGESMFSREQFASQVALVALVEHLREKQFTMLDAQMESDHLRQFGLYTIIHDEYLRLLRNSLGDQRSW
jgi:leucyl/phenylalanyl-tRNA--protein transferase